MTPVLFAALVWQIVDFLRELRNVKTQASAVITQATAWLGGVAAVIAGSHASATAAVVIPGTNVNLGKLDGWSQILVGMLVASLASSAVDVKQAIDNTDTSTKPPLAP